MAYGLATHLQDALDDERDAQLDEIREELDSVIRMIARNPKESLRERPSGRGVLKALERLSGAPSTIKEIASEAGRTDVDTAAIMQAIHGHGLTTIIRRDGPAFYALRSDAGSAQKA